MALISQLTMASGSVGSELLGRGFGPGDFYRPTRQLVAAVSDIHRRYAECPVKLLAANTFMASKPSEVDYFVKLAVDISAGRQKIGLPLGYVYLTPALVEAGLKAGADLVMLLTNTGSRQIARGADILDAVAPGMDAIVSASPATSESIISGESIIEAFSPLASRPWLIPGLDCGNGPASFIGGASSIARLCNRLYIAPSTGLAGAEPDNLQPGDYPLAPAKYAEEYLNLIESIEKHLQDTSGLQIIAGACCGATPRHITAFCEGLQDKFPHVYNVL